MNVSKIEYYTWKFMSSIKDYISYTDCTNSYRLHSFIPTALILRPTGPFHRGGVDYPHPPPHTHTHIYAPGYKCKHLTACLTKCVRNKPLASLWTSCYFIKLLSKLVVVNLVATCHAHAGQLITSLMQSSTLLYKTPVTRPNNWEQAVQMHLNIGPMEQTCAKTLVQVCNYFCTLHA